MAPFLRSILRRRPLGERARPSENQTGQNDGAFSAISYSAAETSFKGLNVSQAFSSLTGVFEAGKPTSPDTYAAMRGKSILDIVKDDLQRVERLDMSRADKQKLAAWKELARQRADQQVLLQLDERPRRQGRHGWFPGTGRFGAGDPLRQV
ncbi:DUF1552 domain-containing protein [Sorangium sp. So ce367]|uniref:DUF1552 domain-containing protein n=1 Tax=Sorangium sp. So ce367 TaxID=3133305 RepID=UPI003F6362C5